MSWAILVSQALANARHSPFVALQDLSANLAMLLANLGCMVARPATAFKTTLWVQLKTTQAASMNFNFVVMLKPYQTAL